MKTGMIMVAACGTLVLGAGIAGPWFFFGFPCPDGGGPTGPIRGFLAYYLSFLVVGRCTMEWRDLGAVTVVLFSGVLPFLAFPTSWLCLKTRSRVLWSAIGILAVAAIAGRMLFAALYIRIHQPLHWGFVCDTLAYALLLTLAVMGITGGRRQSRATAF